jgi:GxxExxY protein
MKHGDITGKIIKCFYNVYNILGYGFLEKVYENALAEEFRREGLNFGQQVSFEVLFRDKIVGKYVADFIIEDRVVVEVKAMSGIGGSEKAQLLNYLKATGIEVGLVLNFGKEAEFERMFFEVGWNGKK